MDAVRTISWVMTCSALPLGVFCLMSYYFRRNIEPMKKRAKERNRIIKLEPQKQLRADNWIDAAYNSWAVFGRTSENTIVVFNLAGKARCELCLPVDCQSFYVDEDTLHLRNKEDEDVAYGFHDVGVEQGSADIKKSVILAHGYGEKLQVVFDGRQSPKHFHYNCSFPSWVYPAARIVFFALTAIGALIRLMTRMH